MPSRPVLRIPILVLLLAPAALLFLGCPNNPPDELVSSRSYSGHESDLDANNFVRAYPAAVGTRLDDCQLCHRAGVAATDTSTIYNACNYCHLIPFPDATYTTGVPASYWDTLNDFGQDYMTAGRDEEAFATIAAEDSDGDTFSNTEEITDSRFPGNPNSKPGNPLAATIELTHAQVAAMTQHSQFLLMNTTRQQYDDYVTYNGPKVKDLLAAAGVDLTGATGITVFAPDGFRKDFTLSNVNDQYPDGLFDIRRPVGDGTDPALRELSRSHADHGPDGAAYADGDGPARPLADHRPAARRGALDTSYYDAVTGKLEGEGPFRIIPPQSHRRPTGPRQWAAAGQPRRRLELPELPEPQRRRLGARHVHHPHQPHAGRRRGIRHHQWLVVDPGQEDRDLRTEHGLKARGPSRSGGRARSFDATCSILASPRRFSPSGLRRLLEAQAPSLKLDGYLQLWYLYEQAENGKLQAITGDPGAQAASGFSLNRARLQAALDLGAFKAVLQFRLEGGSLGLLDAYGSWQPFGPALVLRLGQMKIPSAWEVAVGDEALDFATRSRFANEVANWSLSKSSSSTHPFYLLQTQARDLGLGFDGYFRGFRYFLMVGNGLGANNYVGAEENRQFVVANAIGAYFYGARLSYDLLYELRQRLRPTAFYLELGGHANCNHHPNLIYNDNQVY